MLISNINQECASKSIGSIPLRNAHIWYRRSYGSAQKSILFVIPYGVDFERTKLFDGEVVRFSNIGAFLSYWQKSSKVKLLEELKELLIELAFSGGDMKQMLPEMMKIKEFAALGSECRFLESLQMK